MPSKEELIRAFIEADCKKFAGLIEVYIKMIEARIPFVDNADRAQGMAEAVEMLRGGVEKAEQVAKMVLEGKYKELEDLMAVEALPPHMKQSMN